jgi:Zn-dependent protease with chaperone function
MHARAIGIVWMMAVGLAATTAIAAEKLKLDGYAEYWEGEFLIVDGQRVQADSKTKFEGRVRTLRAIRLGYEVVVQGKRLGDGSILAKRIEVHKNMDTEVDRELRKAFDEMEASYRQRGRVADVDASGKVVQDQGALLVEGPSVERVRRITANLVPPYLIPSDFRVYVVENEEWNAMAAPNYSIFVYTGLLEAMNDDEVAIVLGHEIAHATHEHSRRQYGRTQWAGIGAMMAGTVLGEYGSAAEMGSALAANAVVNSYSRNHEDQADRVGMRYAYEGGYDVTKAPEIWAKFEKKYGDSPVAVNFFFGEHSRSEKRADLLEEQIEWNYRSPDENAPPPTGP